MVTKAKLFQETMFYLTNLIMQVQNGNWVLNRLKAIQEKNSSA